MITGDRARMMAMIQSAADDAIAKAEVAGEMTPAKAMASLQEEWLAGGMNARSKKAAPAPAAVSQESAGAPSPARKSLTSMLTGSSSKKLSSAPASADPASAAPASAAPASVAPASATPASAEPAPVDVPVSEAGADGKKKKKKPSKKN